MILTEKLWIVVRSWMPDVEELFNKEPEKMSVEGLLGSVRELQAEVGAEHTPEVWLYWQTEEPEGPTDEDLRSRRIDPKTKLYCRESSYDVFGPFEYAPSDRQWRARP
jgi:hypothetical protein